jgi:hypothetical protein
MGKPRHTPRAMLTGLTMNSERTGFMTPSTSDNNIRGQAPSSLRYEGQASVGENEEEEYFY